jgi:hypothetical protein
MSARVHASVRAAAVAAAVALSAGGGAGAAAQPSPGAARAAPEVREPRAPRDDAPRPIVVPPAEYAARRSALLGALGDTVAVVAFGAREPAVDHETFSQAPRFAYLTGFREPNAALVLVKRGRRPRRRCSRSRATWRATCGRGRGPASRGRSG